MHEGRALAGAQAKVHQARLLRAECFSRNPRAQRSPKPLACAASSTSARFIWVQRRTHFEQNGDRGKVLEISVAADPAAPRRTIRIRRPEHNIGAGCQAQPGLIFLIVFRVPLSLIAFFNHVFGTLSPSRDDWMAVYDPLEARPKMSDRSAQRP
jgi:hypothetical protein